MMDKLMEQNELWLSYAENHDQGIRDKLILRYAYLVKIVAGKLAIFLSQQVEVEDLYSYGIFGLIDAIERFDVTRGVRFETYASLRIRGSIIDEIRKLDWVPRSLRNRAKQLDAIYSETENLYGREPTEQEISEKLGITEDEARDLIKKSVVVSLISLDDYLEQNQEAPFLAENTHKSPQEELESQTTKEMLAEAIKKLSEKEQRVIALYYYEELTLKEISAVLGVTESRVSQIHTKAVIRLKNILGRQKYLLFD